MKGGCRALTRRQLDEAKRQDDTTPNARLFKKSVAIDSEDIGSSVSHPKIISEGHNVSLLQSWQNVQGHGFLVDGRNVDSAEVSSKGNVQRWLNPGVLTLAQGMISFGHL